MEEDNLKFVYYSVVSKGKVEIQNKNVKSGQYRDSIPIILTIK